MVWVERGESVRVCVQLLWRGDRGDAVLLNM